jgi:hypothetical protein
MSGGAPLIPAVLARRPRERRWALAGALSDDDAPLDDSGPPSRQPSTRRRPVWPCQPEIAAVPDGGHAQ